MSHLLETKERELFDGSRFAFGVCGCRRLPSRMAKWTVSNRFGVTFDRSGDENSRLCNNSIVNETHATYLFHWTYLR
jgi:hypothetical protein